MQVEELSKYRKRISKNQSNTNKASNDKSSKYQNRISKDTSNTNTMDTRKLKQTVLLRTTSPAKKTRKSRIEPKDAKWRRQTVLLRTNDGLTYGPKPLSFPRVKFASSSSSTRSEKMKAYWASEKGLERKRKSLETRLNRAVDELTEARANVEEGKKVKKIKKKLVDVLHTSYHGEAMHGMKTTDDIIGSFKDNSFPEEHHIELMDYLIRNNLWDVYRRNPDSVYELFESEIGLEALPIYHPPPSKNVKIGAAYTGYYDVVGTETQDYWIPKSPNCFEHLYEYLEQNHPNLVKCGQKVKYTKNNCYAISSCHIKKYFQKSLKFVRIETFQGTYKEDAPSCIIYKCEPRDGSYVLLCKTEYDEYHTVFIKNGWVDTVMLTTELVKETLTSEDVVSAPMKEFNFKNPDERFVVYDIEAINKIGESHQPILVGAYEVCMKEPLNESNFVLFKGYDCIDQFIQWLPTTNSRCVFAHNGGSYDHLYMMRSSLPLFTDAKKNAGNFKEIQFTYEDREYSLRDSINFMKMSLKDMNDAMKNTQYKKLKCDSIKKIREKHMEDEEFIRYLKHDVMGMAESLISFEKSMNEFNLSITTSITLSGASMTFWRNAFPYYKKLRIPVKRSLKKFIDMSIYGGRVLHHYRVPENGEELICLDFNSLYPTAMYKHNYPIGSPVIVKEFDNIDFKTHLGIYDVTIDAGNVNFSIIPYKEALHSMITYRAGIFRGVYTSVDIQAMKNANAQILQVHQGVQWIVSAPIFKEYVDLFYNKRLEYQREGNATEAVTKLMMNSLYGKFAETITSMISFNDNNKSKVSSAFKLKNGQTLYNLKQRKRWNYPKQIASFVLSYARYEMNQIFEFIHPGDLFYSDTDSIYITKAKYRQLIDAAPHLFGNELGQFKNDYGTFVDENNTVQDVTIKDWVFSDYKRYWLQFNVYNKCKKCKIGGTDKPIKSICEHGVDFAKKQVKCKCNGYRTYNDSNDLFATKTTFLKLTCGLDIYTLQEKWVKSVANGVVVNVKDFKFVVDPSKRRDWMQMNQSRPFGYDEQREEEIATYVHFKKFNTTVDERKYHPGRSYVYFSKPLSYEHIILDENGKSNLIINEMQVYRNSERKRKNETKIESYKVNQYGAFEKCEQTLGPHIVSFPYDKHESTMTITKAIMACKFCEEPTIEIKRIVKVFAEDGGLTDEFKRCYKRHTETSKRKLHEYYDGKTVPKIIRPYLYP